MFLVIKKKKPKTKKLLQTIQIGAGTRLKLISIITISKKK